MLPLNAFKKSAPRVPRKLSRVKRHHRLWTKSRRRKVERYLRLLQRKLRLRDWTIVIDWKTPCDTDALAAVCPMGNSKHAIVRLSPEFLDQDPELQSQVLIHEMIHCHLFLMGDLPGLSMEKVSSYKTQAVFNVAYNATLEQTVDALADAFAGLLPKLEV